MESRKALLSYLNFITALVTDIFLKLIFTKFYCNIINAKFVKMDGTDGDGWNLDETSHSLYFK